MAAGTYSLRTLNDNWFEDRLQPADSLSATSGFSKRAARAYETDIAYIGERYDVLARIARMPPRESYATPDDGFRERDRISSVDFAHPRSRKEFVANPPAKPRLVTSESVPEVAFEDRRPVPGPQRGFGSALPRHEANHDQRFWNTASGEFFGYAGSRRPRARTYCHPDMQHAGVTSESEEKRVEGVMVGQLCGENYNDGPDPAKNSKCQRAWLYQSDPSLSNVHLGGTRPKVSKVDNALSLPIGEGAMSRVRSDLTERKGRLYRTATTITKGLGSRPGYNLFQDG